MSIDAPGQNRVNGPGMPMGLGMALAQNADAMNRFSALSEEKKQAFINGTHTIQSKSEMQNYVRSISDA